MNKTFYALSFAVLSISALKADQVEADQVEKAIAKGRADTIKALVKAGHTYREDAFKGYIELAEAKLAEKKEAAGSYSYKHLSGLDLFGGGAEAGLIITNAITLFMAWKAKNSADPKEKKQWKGFNAAVMAAFTSFYYLGGLIRKLQKQDKKLEDVDKAEKVLRAVKSLKVAQAA